MKVLLGKELISLEFQKMKICEKILDKQKISEEIHEFGLSIPVDEKILYEMYLAIVEYKNTKSDCDGSEII